MTSIINFVVKHKIFTSKIVVLIKNNIKIFERKEKNMGAKIKIMTSKINITTKLRRFQLKYKPYFGIKRRDDVKNRKFDVKMKNINRI